MWTMKRYVRHLRLGYICDIFVLFIDPEMNDFAVMFKLSKAEFFDVHYLCKFVWITCTLGEIMILVSFFFLISEIVYRKKAAK